MGGRIDARPPLQRRHLWSGHHRSWVLGSGRRSFTDPLGPDVSIAAADVGAAWAAAALAVVLLVLLSELA